MSHFLLLPLLCPLCLLTLTKWVWIYFLHSLALQPYYGMTHEEVVTYIKDGNFLQAPDNCPVRVYDVMKMCFQAQPATRPPFRTILQLLEDISSGKW